MTPERSAQLAAVKLRGLVGEYTQHGVGGAAPLGRGAVLEIGSSGWAYLPETRRGSLGVAVVWARRHGLDSVNLVVDEGGEDLAFAAGGFADPVVRVWRAEGRELRPVEPREPRIPAPATCPELVALLAEAGLDVVADHGVWLGEINGLEVARVGERDDGCGIAIGVGAYDQFAAATINRDRSDRDALEIVASMVRTHRSPGTAPHAIGRLVRARWLRAQACADPTVIGVDALEPLPLLEPRPGLNETQPAAASGRRDGRPVLAVFSVGLDAGLAETCAGLVRFHQPDELTVVLPPRDRHPRIEQMLTGLLAPARLVELDGAWAD